MIGWLTLAGFAILVAAAIYGEGPFPTIGAVVCIIGGAGGLGIDRLRNRRDDRLFRRWRGLRASAALAAVMAGLLLLASPAPPVTRLGGLAWICAGCAGAWVIALFPYLRLLSAVSQGRSGQDTRMAFADGDVALVDRIAFGFLTAMLLLVVIHTPVTMAVAGIALLGVISVAAFTAVAYMLLHVPGVGPWKVWTGTVWGAAVPMLIGQSMVGCDMAEAPSRALATGWLLIGTSFGLAGWAVFGRPFVWRLWKKMGGSDLEEAEGV
ncbi:MAG TPA: hypothetical protein VM537_09925 [Anaerolineae bacterium]|nr:hypothetical protein [Anaerolineae bacterium]